MLNFLSRWFFQKPRRLSFADLALSKLDEAHKLALIEAIARQQRLPASSLKQVTIKLGLADLFPGIKEGNDLYLSKAEAARAIEWLARSLQRDQGDNRLLPKRPTFERRSQP